MPERRGMPAGKEEAAAAAAERDIGRRRHVRTRREGEKKIKGERDRVSAGRGEAGRPAEWRSEIDEGGAARKQRWQHLLVSLR